MALESSARLEGTGLRAPSSARPVGSFSEATRQALVAGVPLLASLAGCAPQDSADSLSTANVGPGTVVVVVDTDRLDNPSWGALNTEVQQQGGVACVTQAASTSTIPSMTAVVLAQSFYEGSYLVDVGHNTENAPVQLSNLFGVLRDHGVPTRYLTTNNALGEANGDTIQPWWADDIAGGAGIEQVSRCEDTTETECHGDGKSNGDSNLLNAGLDAVQNPTQSNEVTFVQFRGLHAQYDDFAGVDLKSQADAIVSQYPTPDCLESCGDPTQNDWDSCETEVEMSGSCTSEEVAAEALQVQALYDLGTATEASYVLQMAQAAEAMGKQVIVLSDHGESFGQLWKDGENKFTFQHQHFDGGGERSVVDFLGNVTVASQEATVPVWVIPAHQDGVPDSSLNCPEILPQTDAVAPLVLEQAGIPLDELNASVQNPFTDSNYSSGLESSNGQPCTLSVGVSGVKFGVTVACAQAPGSYDYFFQGSDGSTYGTNWNGEWMPGHPTDDTAEVMERVYYPLQQTFEKGVY